MGKQITLKESEFRNLIAEKVAQALNEIGNTPAGQFMLGRLAARKQHNDSHWDGAIDTTMHAMKQSKTKDDKGHDRPSDDFMRGVADERERQKRASKPESKNYAKALNELDWKTGANAYMKAKAMGDNESNCNNYFIT